MPIREPHLQFMDQEETKSLLEEHGGQQVLVVEADQTVKEYLASVRCPECGSHVVPIVNARNPFTPGKLSPNFLARCSSCGCEFDPYTSLIAKEGSLQFSPPDPT